MEKPYVSITGISSPVEMGEVSDIFHQEGFSLESTHIPSIGILVSYETMNGELTENLRYPPFKELPYILTKASRHIFTTIHYSSSAPRLDIQVNELLKEIYGEGLCKGLQLNIAWPTTSEVALIKDKFPDLKIILQASKSMLEDPGFTEKILNYGVYLDYILIDPSSGKGKNFDIPSSLQIYNTLKNEYVVGFAGGLTSDNVSRTINLLAREHKIGTNFSLDVEKGVRNLFSEVDGDDMLNFSKARSYIRSAYGALAKSKPTN